MKSPLEPQLPCNGILGVRSLLSISSQKDQPIWVDIQEEPFDRALARKNMVARMTSLGAVGPTPAA